MKKTRTIQGLPIDSTWFCCNFVNTVYSWKSDDNYDFLEDYHHFIDWCFKLSVANAGYLNRLRAAAKRKPEEARRVMEEIRATRSLIHAFISAVTKQDQIKIQKLLVNINPLLTEAWSNTRLDFNGYRFTSSHKVKPLHLKSPLWIIMTSLNDLLTGMDITRMKECPTCGWVFYDETKNGKRKWCNPSNCGTQDKMSRYHQRLREQND
jgi:predicted RNA-binding Zn ribbon-like protein